MPGPKPRPDELKALEGEPNKDRYNPSRPKPPVSRPTYPAFLSGQAKAEWRRICPELEALGLLSQVDRAALAAYCQAFGRWAQAEKKLAELGKMSPDQMAFLYKTTNGNLIINPLLSVANKAAEQMHKFLAEFGMTPASRQRLSVDPPEQEEDPMEKVLREAEETASKAAGKQSHEGSR